MRLRFRGRPAEVAGQPDHLSAVQAPAVSPAVYDERYYRELCIGSEEWHKSSGTDAHPLYEFSLGKAELRSGEALVDIGTGRGELVIAAVRKGARWAVGIEYSMDAISLARQTWAANGHPSGAVFALADARQLPLPTGSADLVTMLDIVEHLTPAELDASLREARRVLKPGGRLFVHTAPTRTIYDVTYRLLRALWPTNRASWPANPRHELEAVMHVNEQTHRRLRRTLNAAGFRNVRVSYGNTLYLDFFPSHGARELLRRISRVPLARRLVLSDLWAEAK